MFITPAGLPSLTQIFWVAVGGYLMAGGANAINMWFDRDIDSTMSRTRLRPIPAGRISPAAGLAFGIALGAAGIRRLLVSGQSAERVARARRAALLRLRLYDLAQAHESAEHRDRRRGRRLSSAGGLGGDDRPTRPGGGVSLRHHLLLDASAFLGAGAHQASRLREGGRADAAGGAGARHEPSTRCWSTLSSCFRSRSCRRSSVPSACFYGVAAAILGARLLWYCVRLIRERGMTPVAWKMYRYSLLYLALLFVAMGIDRALPFGHRPAPKDVIILARPDEASLAFPAADEHQHKIEDADDAEDAEDTGRSTGCRGSICVLCVLCVLSKARSPAARTTDSTVAAGTPVSRPAPDRDARTARGRRTEPRLSDGRALPARRGVRAA